MNISTIAPDVNFLETLAAGLLKDSSDSGTPLSAYKILLPNRRSCQNLRDAFLDKTDGNILLLPQIRPLGDVEEEELFFAEVPEIGEKLAALPAALSPTRRQFYLVRLIRQMEEKLGNLPRKTLDQSLRLAQALGLLLDQMIIEELSFERLQEIVPSDFSAHWQITLDFLDILRVQWPEILKAEGVIEAAARRNLLLDLQSDYWREFPPQNPVIAAGSTGTMPATARLMKVIAGLPKGQVILPGVDLGLDDASWQVIGPSHPQSLFKDLFSKWGIERRSVIPYVHTPKSRNGRAHLVSEMMRPADTVYKWREGTISPADMEHALSGIRLYECDTLRQEAFVVALKLREVAEDKQKTAAFVTPNRELAAQVKLVCERWGLVLDDTGGSRLSDSDWGRFFRMSLDLFIEDFRPSLLLGILKHPLCTLGMERKKILQEATEIDALLRGPLPKDVFAEIMNFECIQKIIILRKEFSLFEGIDVHPFSLYVQKHIALLEYLAGEEILWAGDVGEAASSFVQNLIAEGAPLGTIGSSDYADVMGLMMKSVLLRPKYGTHPRLLIMGQIEARLLKADVMILGGLNEGVWPALPDADPWMSRPMRGDVGLPDAERGIALAAHDFAQAFCSDKVVLTRSVREGNAPSVPARWLQRLDIVLKAYGFGDADIRRGPYKEWAIMIDRSDEARPFLRPAPKPDLQRRPVSLPVTAIETWMRDPYSLYARYILGLKSLDALEKSSDAALRGSWLHHVFEWFVRTYPKDIPDNADQLMLDYALSHPKVPRDMNLFIPRLQRILQWFIEQEISWRNTAQVLPEGLEIKGKMKISEFELHAKADRIDRLKDSGAAAIIDYKTGTLPSEKDIKAGLSPQMPLEGAILEAGGFVQINVHNVGNLQFRKVSGGLKAGDIKELKDDLENLIDVSVQGLEQLIKTFQDGDVPYFSLPDTAKAPPEGWQDYRHLARVKEWASIESGEGE